MLIPKTTPEEHRRPDRESGRLLQVSCESRRRVREGVVIQHNDWPRTSHAGFCMFAPACHNMKNRGRSGHYREAKRNHCGRTLGCSDSRTHQQSERPILKRTVHSSATLLRSRPALGSQSDKKVRVPRWMYAPGTAAFAHPKQARTCPDHRTKMLLQTSLEVHLLLNPTSPRDPVPPTSVRSARRTAWPRTHSLELHTTQSAAQPYARRHGRWSRENPSNLVARGPWKIVVDTPRNRLCRNRRIRPSNARRA